MRNPAIKWLAAAATASAVVGGLLISGSPAFAAEPAPSVATHALSTQQQARAVTATVPGAKAVPDGVGHKGHICLTYATSYCIETNGPGNQVTITKTSADYANFTVVYEVGSGDNINIEWQDGNGNCLREGTQNDVKIENGSCAAPDPYPNTDTWDLSDYHTVVNLYYLDIMLVHKAADGFNVYAYPSTMTGDLAQWNVPI